MSNLIVITGGPGSGKTTLLKALKSRGCVTYDEIPRLLIEDQLKQSEPILPWTDLRAFASLCYSSMMNQKKSVRGNSAFVDRAIGDIIAYLHIGGFEAPAEYELEAVEGYSKEVYILKPHREIYVQDEVRPHSFEEAIEIHYEIDKIYRELGFDVVDIPFTATEVQLEMICGPLGL